MEISSEYLAKIHSHSFPFLAAHPFSQSVTRDISQVSHQTPTLEEPRRTMIVGTREETYCSRHLSLRFDSSPTST